VSDDIDKVAECRDCRAEIEHYAGHPDLKSMTPYWRHIGPIPGDPHPAVPDPDTIRAVEQ
jgi:hypothetical protein